MSISDKFAIIDEHDSPFLPRSTQNAASTERNENGGEIVCNLDIEKLLGAIGAARSQIDDNTSTRNIFKDNTKNNNSSSSSNGINLSRANEYEKLRMQTYDYISRDKYSLYVHQHGCKSLEFYCFGECCSSSDGLQAARRLLGFEKKKVLGSSLLYQCNYGVQNILAIIFIALWAGFLMCFVGSSVAYHRDFTVASPPDFISSSDSFLSTFESIPFLIVMTVIFELVFMAVLIVSLLKILQYTTLKKHASIDTGFKIVFRDFLSALNCVLSSIGLMLAVIMTLVAFWKFEMPADLTEITEEIQYKNELSKVRILMLCVVFSSFITTVEAIITVIFLSGACNSANCLCSGNLLMPIKSGRGTVADFPIIIANQKLFYRMFDRRYFYSSYDDFSNQGDEGNTAFLNVLTAEEALYLINKV